ncbi:alpha/beta fold hydrolase [Pseudogracilibacillus auburnensis]|uniref:Pimeloyl-ACP methyl ester carboxylesterase n=1 Tax=Pseudogracilibacillus auburnensis TaxID=1494959 RepID=A0A2V3W4N8_9BACI|nr:alpha/beta hydrolase [Pseudogracilibacillus auburnensis]MBO1004881.1 alpha/beta hydrolase [Pseudogracilibacillus auburnensis]PXW88048.1 pimeloyl-ACP methyl ester carboxylesterase [Pseudogracilibacillus auburnensis]
MEQYVTVGENNIYVSIKGEGPPIVLIHGTASYHFCWRNIVATLSENYSVYALDLLGYGESDKPVNACYSKEAHAQRVIEVLRKLNLSSVHLIGHSMGGEVSVHVALKAPELVEDLTLIAPDGFRKGVHSFTKYIAKRGLLNGMFKGMLRRPPKPKMMSRMLGLPIETLTPDLLAGWTKPYSDPNMPYIITKTLADDDTGVISSKVCQLSLRVLLIYGTNDKLVPQHVFRAYEKELPNISVEKYEGFGHVLMEECPEKLTESILRFI